MKKLTIACAVVLSSVAVTGAATAANGNGGDHARNLAAKQCAAEKKADKAAFRAAYGDHAMRDCIKGTTTDFKNAAQECRAEREVDADAFRETYGSNGNDGSNGQGRNAFGKCVSKKVHEAEAS